MVNSLFLRYKEPIERAIARSLDAFGPKSSLRDAIEYALKNGGKRFRPAIVYMVAAAIDQKADVSDAALAIEYFHTASLIADDLPCMDDDDHRREQSSLHIVYNEATAILATYALIAAGYDRLRLGAQKSGKSEICSLAIENASFNTGILGAAGGQYDDLYPADLTEEFVMGVIDKKTGTLFEISFVLGWLYGGGDRTELLDLKKTARSFGRAFQISDDFIDLQQDQGGINYPAVAGTQKAYQVLSDELVNYYSGLKKLKIDSQELLSLGELIEKRLPSIKNEACV